MINLHSTYENNCMMDGNFLPALIKYNLADCCSLNIGTDEDYKEKLFDKLKELTYADNTFIDFTHSNDNGFQLLLLCIENPKIPVILELINNLYDNSSLKLLRDMFYTMSVILEPVIFTSILCELYISHIDAPVDIDTYYSWAIFNIIIRKESIEKLFYRIILYPSNGDILSPQQQDLVFRMLNAIMHLNSKEELLVTSYDEIVEDIIDVDKYISKVFGA